MYSHLYFKSVVCASEKYCGSLMHDVTGALVQRCIGHDIKRNILLNRAGKKHQYKSSIQICKQSSSPLS